MLTPSSASLRTPYRLYYVRPRVCACMPVSCLPVSTLPEATHIDLTTLRSRKFINLWRSPWRGMTVREGPNEPSGLGWQDLLNHLRHIKKTNPRREVRRLTFDSQQKLGSLSNLSSATAGLLTHIDFSRNRRWVDFDELATNLPGLRGLGVRGDALKRRRIQPRSKTVQSLLFLVRTWVMLFYSPATSGGYRIASNTQFFLFEVFLCETNLGFFEWLQLSAPEDQALMSLP